MVPVLDVNKNPLMPCTEKRARKLIEKGQAKPYWYKGLFCIILQRPPKTTYKQDICVGIDIGSKMSALTIKTEAHTLFNLQYSAPTHVKSKVEERSILRRSRRGRKTPYRKCRFNRSVKNRIPPSTKSRWLQHLRLLDMFSRMYPINIVGVEDVRAQTIKGARKWNKNFSPLEVGKNWFYYRVQELWKLYLYSGFETYTIRQELGLEKGKDKLKVEFKSHCVDSWAIANDIIGGHIEPENKRVVYFKPLNYHRRKLHVTVPTKGGIRKDYGGTLSLGLKRGTIVKHPKWGLSIVGGSSKGRLSLHTLDTNKRLCQNVKKEDLTILTNSKWNILK